MRTTIIGIGYKARQGKGEVARAIRAAYPYDTEIYSFADGVKAVCRWMGMRGKDAPLLQTFGTDVARRLNSDIWVEILLDRIREDAPRVALIPDMRFSNEAAICDYTIRVDRYVDGVRWVAPDRDPHHASETVLDHYDDWSATVVNEGSLEGLRGAAVRAFEILISSEPRGSARLAGSGLVSSGPAGRTLAERV